MSSNVQWAQALKKEKFEYVPDDGILQRIATKYDLNKPDIVHPAFHEGVGRELQTLWKQDA